MSKLLFFLKTDGVFYSGIIVFKVKCQHMYLTTFLITSIKCLINIYSIVNPNHELNNETGSAVWEERCMCLVTWKTQSHKTTR